MKYTNVKFNISDPIWQKVYDAAEEKARLNVHAFCSRPVLIEGGGYNGIWLETQPMSGEMYAMRNMEAAMNNQLFFMENIRADGRIPSVIRFTGDEKHPLDLMFSHFQGYCFPYHALNMYFLNGHDREYLEMLYDVLERFDAYLWKHRDSDGDGCLESWCVWDTGEDNCTRFLGGPDAWSGETAPYGQARLPYESMDVMAYSVDGRQTLSEIAAILFPETSLSDEWQKRADEVRVKLRSYLWQDKRGACYDRDCDNRVMDVLIHNNLRVMYHGGFDSYMASRFVGEHLLNPDEFWTPMPLPSIAANDKLYLSSPNNNWSGQPQGLTYQRAIRALENYGFDRLIPVLGRKLCRAVGEVGHDLRFTQQYDTYTMRPSEYGDGTYGPAILAFLEYTNRMYGVKPERDKLKWSSVDDGTESEYTQYFGDDRYTLKNGRMCEAYINERKIFTCARGTKTVTDMSGGVISRVLL